MTFENLVLEGCSVRGFAFCGVVKALDELGLYDGLKRFAGTSSGSLFAAIMAAGFTPAQIIEVAEELDLSHLQSKVTLCSIYSVVQHYGLNDLSTLETQLRAILEKRGVNPDVTFSELYHITGKELVIVVCNLQKMRPEYIHHATHPHIKVVDAALASISLPFVFKPRRFSFSGNDASSDLYVDGGLVDNYPIFVFNDIRALHAGELEKVDRDNIPPETLGIKLLAADETNGYDVFDGKLEVANVIEYGKALIDTLITQVERNGVCAEYIKQTVGIHTPDVKFTNFALTSTDINYLIDCGYTSVKDALSELKTITI